MNVLFITSYWYYANIKSSFVHAQAKALAQQGAKIRVIIPTPPFSNRIPHGAIRCSKLLYKEIVDDVEIYYVICLSFSNYGNTVIGKKSINSYAAIFSLFFVFKYIFSDYIPNVIHAHAFGLGSEVGEWLKKRLKCPLVTTSHGGDANDLLDKGKNKALMKSAKGTDLIITVSKTLEKRLRSNLCEIDMITNYLGCTSFNGRVVEIIDTEALHLVSCSSIISIKRIELIVDALSKIPPCIKVIWTHLGEGPLIEKIRAYSEEKLSECKNINYEFCGFVDNEKVRELYISMGSQLFITTSSTEGLPVSLMEASSVGIPLMGTAVGGIPEIIKDGHNGYLLSLNPTPEEISEHIIEYYNLSIDERKMMSKNSQKVWKRDFDIDVCVKNLLLIYDTLIRKKEQNNG